MAAWWLNDAMVTFDAREGAYRMYRERGDRVAAARVAMALAWDYKAFRGDRAVANGWLRRARTLLEGLDPTPEHGWFALREGAMALGTDTVAAKRLGAQAANLGRSLDSIDLEMVGLSLQGLAMVSEGEVTEGMSRLDEVTAAVLAQVGSYHHPVSTCRMGPSTAAMAVVDARGNVHGVEDLSVIDASIMPAIPGANTNLPTIMLAERCAAWLTGVSEKESIAPLT
jgi:choline dehydrogenase-like flavoprotein